MKNIYTKILFIALFFLFSNSAHAAPCAIGGTVTISANCEINGVANYNNLTITGGAQVTSAVGSKMEIVAVGTVQIDAGSGIDVSGKGNSVSGQGGNGVNVGGIACSGTFAGGGGGGGYGGIGINGVNDCCGGNGGNGGTTYGSAVNPIDLGSPGGIGGGNAAGAGIGGGAVKISASNITVNGFIRANGTAGSDPIGQDGTGGGGGGSGGSIWLITDNLNIGAGGALEAKGGNGGADGNCGGLDGAGGAGAGGRIAIYYVTLTGAITYNKAGGAGGNEGTYYKEGLPVCDLTSPTTPATPIVDGDTVNLTWTSSDATSATITPPGVVVAVNGNMNVTPAVTTTYKLDVTGDDANFCTATVYVIPLVTPSCSLTTSLAILKIGEATTLTWATTDAIGASIDHGIGNITPIPAGEIFFYPTAVGTYPLTMTVTSASATIVTCSTANITVNPASAIPINTEYGNYKEFNKSTNIILNDVARALLSFMGGIALFVFIIAGIYFMMSRGNPEIYGKAKKMLLYAIIGLLIILLSYAILVVVESVAV